MIYVPVMSLDVYHNFGLEYYLMTEHHFNEPVFMLWSTTPTVMLGKYQDAATELNVEAVKRNHVKVARRYSGGGTIYTDQGGCQFTLIYPDDRTEIDFSSGLELIQKALNQIGIKATTDSRNDLVVGGRKVSGSAQYVTSGYKLHHGSLLFESNLDLMNQLLNVDPVKLAAKRIASVHQRTVNLNEQEPSWTAADFRENLRQAVYDLTSFQEYHLTADEQARVAEIGQQRFADPKFIYGRQGQGAFQVKRYFQGGGLVKIAYSIYHDQLADVHLTGDFFSNLDAVKFEHALDGTDYDRRRVSNVIRDQLAEDPILGVDADQLVNMLFDHV